MTGLCLHFLTMKPMNILQAEEIQGQKAMAELGFGALSHADGLTPSPPLGSLSPRASGYLHHRGRLAWERTVARMPVEHSGHRPHAPFPTAGWQKECCSGVAMVTLPLGAYLLGVFP